MFKSNRICLCLCLYSLAISGSFIVILRLFISTCEVEIECVIIGSQNICVNHSLPSLKEHKKRQIWSICKTEAIPILQYVNGLYERSGSEATNMACNMTKGTFGHWRKLSSWVSLPN